MKRVLNFLFWVGFVILGIPALPLIGYLIVCKAETRIKKLKTIPTPTPVPDKMTMKDGKIIPMYGGMQIKL